MLPHNYFASPIMQNLPKSVTWNFGIHVSNSCLLLIFFLLALEKDTNVTFVKIKVLKWKQVVTTISERLVPISELFIFGRITSNRKKNTSKEKQTHTHNKEHIVEPCPCCDLFNDKTDINITNKYTYIT